MKDRSFIHKLNLTFIALTVMTVNHCLSAWNTGKFRVPPVFGPGGGAQRTYDSSNINHAVNNASTYEFRHPDADFRFSSPDIQANKIDNIRNMIHQRIHSTCTNPAMSQPHKHQGSFDEDFFDYVLEELIEQRDNSFNRLGSFVAATEASMYFSAVLPMGGSAIASSSQPVPCRDSTSNSNDITSITNMISIENIGLVNGNTIGESAMWLGS